MKTLRDKNQIVEEAITLFKENGYENTTVKDICERCNLPRSSFYTMFSDKKDILIYSVSDIKENFQAYMPEFVKAPNDFERIWFITDAFLQRAIVAGPELCGEYLILEIKGELDVLRLIEGFNDWLAQLIDNCRASGIAEVKGDSTEIIRMEINLCKAVFLDWTRYKGKFPLRQACRYTIEALLQIKPEYRRTFDN